MAAKKIKTTILPVNEITKLTFTAPADGTNGVSFVLDAADERSLILFDGGTAGGTVKIKAPTDGFYAAATSDLTLSVSANDIAAVWVETAKYANKDGTIVAVPSAETIKVAIGCKA